MPPRKKSIEDRLNDLDASCKAATAEAHAKIVAECTTFARSHVFVSDWVENHAYQEVMSTSTPSAVVVAVITAFLVLECCTGTFDKDDIQQKARLRAELIRTALQDHFQR